MLREVRNVKQEAVAGRRRWFESDGLDLVLWLDAANEVSGFQLCYDLGPGEHALTWRQGAGFAHSTIDSGEETPLKNCTPILLPAGKVPWDELAKLFEQRSGSLEPKVRELIQEKLAARA